MKIFFTWFEEAVLKKFSFERQQEIIANIQDVLANKMEVKLMISNLSRTIEESLEARELKGRLESKLETAKNLIDAGMDEKFIAKMVGLSVEEIRELKNKK